MNDTEALALFKICAQLQKEVHDIKSENDIHCGAISCLEKKVKELEEFKAKELEEFKEKAWKYDQLCK